MARWFRFYDEALDNPKVQRLAPHLFKTWVNLLCLASKDGGKLPSNDDIAFRLRISVQDAAQQVEDLILAGLIDVDAARARAPHNWEDRQYASDSSAERTKKYRENRKKQHCDSHACVTVTVQKQSRTEAETEAEQSRTRERAKAVSNLISGKGGRSVSERLQQKAEGCGLPVKAYLARSLEPDVGKPNGMFLRLCVDDLKRKLPRMTETEIRSAFDAGNDAAWGYLQSKLVGAQ